MKKWILLFVFLCCSLGLTYQVKPLAQVWRFDAPASLDQLSSLSGKWEIATPEKLNQPFLSQIVRYADFPKVLVKDRDYYDFEASTKLYISGDIQETQAAGLILRYRNLYSFYMLFINAKDKRITLTRAARGGIKAIQRVNHEFSPDQWYELRAVCHLDNIKAYVNDQLLLEAEDDTTTGGKVGLVCAGPSKVYFEGMRIHSEIFEVAKQ